MQKIEFPDIAQSSEDCEARLKKSWCRRQSLHTIAAVVLAAGLSFQAPVFAQVANSQSANAAAGAQAMSGPEKAARKTWHAVMRNTPLPGSGCFHVSYPNVAWRSVECKKAAPRAKPLQANGNIGAPAAGGGTDYFAQSHGLISSAYGKFFVSNVTSETNVRTAQTPTSPLGDLILGPNEYSLQLNTSYAQTRACGDYGSCYVWQQFIYATDYHPGSAEAALFMQYWLYNWGVGNRCPNGWMGGTSGTCYTNSKYVPVPDIPVTNLGDVILSAGAVNGGNDTIALEYGDDSWAVSNTDNSAPCCEGGVDIAGTWNQAEFNVVGDVNLTQAQFNDGSQIIVVLQILDGSQTAPTCANQVFGDGATGETNNMTLGPCATGVANLIDWYGCNNSDLNICHGFDVYGPYIEFAETAPVPVRPFPPPVCVVCRTIAVAPAEEARVQGTSATARFE